MSTYHLLDNMTAAATLTTLPQGQSVSPPGSLPNTPAQNQIFQIEITGVGSLSASVQILVSNDTGPDPNDFNWQDYGAPISVTGTDVGSAAMAGTEPWANFGAYLVSVSGTNASVTVLMSA